ncbi:ATP-binding protein [Ramlibacter sp. PS3R-8]|uniref:hybrid sensor histidine kinase/response regulator n=1 Tax=Ramlibacter sp. PS3R-8 TaxID=3133437 RepID=UPI0030A43E6D
MQATGEIEKTSKAPLVSMRILAILVVAVPLLIYGFLGAFRYLESTAAAERRVSRSLRVAQEHASKVLGGAEALHERLGDLLGGKTVEELRAAEPSLHALLATRTKDQPQIQSIWVIGADGKPIATSLVSPPPALEYSDREYFRRHKAGGAGRFLSLPFKSRSTGESIVDLSTRFDGPGGAFGGVINVSLRTSYFERFYEDLVNDEPGLAVNLFHQAGPIYVRWPVLPGAPDRLSPSSPTLQRVAAGDDIGQTRGVSSVDGQFRIISFQRVGAYPLFVGTGMNITALRNEVLRELAVLLLLGVPPFAAIYFAARASLRHAQEAYESAQRLTRETATRRKAEEALLQAQKLEALGRLTGGVAHDFNNALMVVSNNAYLLARSASGAASSQVKSIQRAVDSATKLTRQLLAFSRRQALVPETVDLADKLPASRSLLAPVLGTQVQLHVEVAPGTRPITVDMAELELALLNLAINSRDAMPDGGTFTVTARNTEDVPPKLAGRAVVAIEAADTGEGIEPAVLDKVFEPFFTTKPVGQGTGLGLSQVYGLCERAGGIATVRSEKGLGTTVTLFFPAAEGAAGGTNERPEAAMGALGKRVLVVEDNDQVAGSLMPLLDALGCQATRVDRASTAREWLAAQPKLPDLVLTDVVMPGEMDGLALAAHLKKSMPGLPVLLMTGYAERLDEIAAMGFEVLPKPCSAEILAAAIARVAQSST